MNIKIFVGLVLLTLLTISCTTIKDCGYDAVCFSNLAKNCKASSLNIVDNGNLFKLTVRGIVSDNCEVSYKIIKINNSYKNEHPELSNVIEQKAVTCYLNLVDTTDNNQTYLDLIKKFNESIDKHCSGPLKDIFLEPASTELKKQFTESIK